MGNKAEILKNSIVHELLVWINDIYIYIYTYICIYLFVLSFPFGTKENSTDWVSTDGIIMNKKHLFNHGTVRK